MYCVDDPYNHSIWHVCNMYVVLYVYKWVNDHNINSEKVKQTGEYTRNLMVEGKGSNNSWEVWT